MLEITLNPNIFNIQNVMGFLNEVTLKYPNAIPFISGRPDTRDFNIDDCYESIDAYLKWYQSKNKYGENKTLSDFAQYSKSKGIINELIVKFLRKDENIIAEPDSTILTVGTQEALALVVLTLCDKENDIILVADPCYIGLPHFALLSGYALECVNQDGDGVDVQDIKAAVAKAKIIGKNVKMLYVIPDFQNPTGIQMSIERRRKLLEMAEEYNFVIIEDNAYGEFFYEYDKVPTIKSLDTKQRVIYIGSFSKSLFPSLRLAVIVYSGEIKSNGGNIRIIDEMAKVKNYLTVNTPSITQAILAGILLKNDFSLLSITRKKRLILKEKLNKMINALDRHMTFDSRINWNKPSGGFFLQISLPFEVTGNIIEDCAKHFHVIVMPTSFFSLKGNGLNSVRLAFSELSVNDIEDGIKRFSDFVKHTINSQKKYNYE